MLGKGFILFYRTAIERAVQVMSNFFWFLSYEFPKLVVLVTEYRKKMVQYK